MKCDGLKVYVPQDGPYGLEPEEGGKLVEEETCYLKSEVDEAIAELKAKLENVQNSMYCDVVDANMKIRKLSRSLWLARALFNGRSSEYFSGMASRCKIGQEEFYQQVDKRAKRYLKASYKCQAMAEKFK